MEAFDGRDGRIPRNGPAGAVLARTCAAVLAAGASTRMGSPKQLLEAAGEPLVRRACRTLLEAGAAEVCLVAGAVCEQVEQAVADLPVNVVFNGCWREGQAGSVRLAANYARQCDAAWLLVMPADMPHVTARHIRNMAACAAAGAPIVASRSPEGTPMAPCLFAARELGLLEGLSGDAGAMRALRAPDVAPRVSLTPFAHPAEALDVDTPAQFAQAKALIESGGGTLAHGLQPGA